jgi:hypothetical protein
MKKIFTTKKLFFLIALCLFYNTYSQQWWNGVSSQNTAICNAATLQANVQSTTDGKGGAIMVWEDSRNGKSMIYAQRINVDGTIKWATNGIRLSFSDSIQTAPKIVADDRGGAYIVWVQMGASNTTDIWGTHIDSTGAELWVGDRAICTATGNQSEVSIATTGSGITNGVVVVWTDGRNFATNGYDIYIHRLTYNGNLNVAQDGKIVTVSNQTQSQVSPQIITSGGNATWIAYRNYMGNAISGFDIYTSYFDLNVNQTYSVDVSQQQGNEDHQKLASDGANGVVIVWDLATATASGQNIYAQRVSIAGTAQWTAGGITVCGVNGVQGNPEIVADGFGNTIMVWIDGRNSLYPILYTQRFNSAGVAKWTANGKAVGSPAVNEQKEVSIVANATGGAVYAFYDARNAGSNGGYNDLFTQQFDSLGNATWGATGVVVSNATNFQNLPKIIASDNGSYIVAWEDSRNGASDIYASKINAAGTLPTKITQFNATKKENNVLLNWTSENEINVAYFNVQRSISGKDFETIGAVNAGKSEYNFIDPLTNILSQTIYYRLQIVDKDGSMHYSKIVTVSNNTKEIIKVYPTIATSQVNIEFDSKTNESLSIKIFDIMGKIVDAKNVKLFAGNNSFYYDCSRLNAGNYFVSLIINNQIIKTENLIKK